ncbi:MAG: hypothetical protein NVS4B12_13050 [Ktedonobacteraceae bacterium]
MTTEEKQRLLEQKLAAFEAMQEEFEASFRFVQDVHGQKRFETFVVADAVRYFHARWICERKGRLLSVAKTSKEYEGSLCLELLRKWQEGDTASVVEFLSRRLDMLPIADITRQIHDAYQEHRDDGLLERLIHGRLIMLNRGLNLIHLLDVLFVLSEEDLIKAVQDACLKYGHTPQQIQQQLQEIGSSLYAYVPHQSLAQRNMLVMNEAGLEALDKPDDLPERRSRRVVPPTELERPFAEHVVEGYQELITPTHNNIKDDRFVDRPEPDESGGVV